MARYKVNSEWTPAFGQSFGGFSVQEADALDTKTGDVFVNGASRVVDADQRPVKGKGGTVPFFGETAWSDAERLASDLYFKAAYGR